MAAKIRHTPAELTNDPSLRWCSYRRWEMLYSDTHAGPVRFLEYVGDAVRVASMEGIAPLAELPTRLQVRRPSVMESYQKEELSAEQRKFIVFAQQDRRDAAKAR